MPEVQQWFIDAINAGKQQPSSGEMPSMVEQPSETLLLRREAGEIRGRLAVKPRILEARRKIRDIWQPRVAQLKPLLEPQEKKLAALKEQTLGHPQATYSGRGSQVSHHCRDCADLSVVEDNVADLRDGLKFAEHHLAAQRREDDRLTKVFDSVTGRERTRLAEIEKMLEAASRGREPEKRIKIPPPPLVNEREAKRSLGPSELLARDVKI